MSKVKFSDKVRLQEYQREFEKGLLSTERVCVCARVRVCACARVRVCARACVRACVCNAQNVVIKSFLFLLPSILRLDQLHS